MTRTLDVRERMRKRYSFKNYPSEFKYRCKCIIVFQNLDGVDVILFGLYVYEHDETNPMPDQRAVYVSYLDSVHYMRPRRMRTFVYHELLISYLDYVRNKGYSTAHIWACPPLKGDDYILFAKPEDQKIPKDDRLRQWYLDMLKDCQKRGIVGKLTNAYDLYFANPKNDATVLPYMEGDYFPAELENIIKDLEEGKNLSKKPDGSGKKKGKKEKKTKKAGGRGGTRSTGLDEDALAASGILAEGVDVKSLQAGGRDAVMKKLGETIHPMKESFLVAFLDWEGAKEEDRVVPKDVMEYREKHGINIRKSVVPPSGMDIEELEDSPKEKPDVKMEDADSKPAAVESSHVKDASSEEKEATENDSAPAKESLSGEETKDEVESSVKQESPDESDAANDKVEHISSGARSEAAAIKKEEADSDEPKEKTADEKGTASSGGGGGDVVPSPLPSAEATATESAAQPADVKSESNDTPAQLAEQSKEGETKEGDSAEEVEETKEGESSKEGDVAPSKQESVARVGKFAAMEKRKKDASPAKPEAEGSKASEQSATPSKSITKDSKGRLVKVIDDDEDEMDCEFLNNRQLFLNLCQGNHYQFDQLRRAKHTSMMVLWHLHNRDAPKFVQQCAVCSREILQGNRYHCPTCADYDMCQECMTNPGVPRHQHPLKAIPVGNQQNNLTAEQRKERQRSIQLHMTLLLHAATCKSQKCASANCAKMKGLLKHGSSCKVKANGGCHVCKRIWALLQIHARQCKEDNCPVPNCMAIRERFRQLTLQQQAMDDRRRQMMNQTYHQQAR